MYTKEKNKVSKKSKKSSDTWGSIAEEFPELFQAYIRGKDKEFENRNKKQ